MAQRAPAPAHPFENTKTEVEGRLTRENQPPHDICANPASARRRSAPHLTSDELSRL
jgi:hypothetical protein